MVKRFVFSIILSLFMCFAGLYLNDRYYHKTGRLLLCIRLKDPKDSRWVTEYGFGHVGGNTNVGSEEDLVLSFFVCPVPVDLTMYAV
ncbi:MAG: hypothetical protein IJJ76_12710 [Ruminococcus sp.]|uniref:hypothetical protein n=1 Tax=Ruminococcus sp. TaxID=41978 RepID=UPI0025E4C5BA|nr:hypothetical protein [Ruminococcus sp.]MBR0530608.1 hypothetical protein [Ruminococcus sp.]